MGTFGDKLRGERENRGIGLDEIAAATKINARFLEALERGAFEQLPSEVFAKGFIRAYAQHIGADAAYLLDEYERERAERTDTENDNDKELIREMSRILTVPGQDPATARRRTIAWIVAGVVIVVAAVWLSVRRGPAEGDSAATRPALIASAQSEQAPEPPKQGPALLAAEQEPTAPATVTEPVIAEPEPAQPAPPPARTEVPPPAEPEETPPPAREPLPRNEQVTKAKPASPPARRETPQPVAPQPEPTPAIEPKPEPKPPGGTGALAPLTIPDYGVGTGIVERRLVGINHRFYEGEQVWFWTKVVGAKTDRAIRHIWIHNGREVSTTELRVEGASWRTYSRHTLWPGSLGAWAVEARDETGRVLARRDFDCVPAD